jgi:acyl-CoA synthetase (NDP forming)
MIAMSHVIAPRSVALFGASEDYGKFGGRITHHLLHHGYSGRIFAINPKRETILGLPCYKTIEDLPEAPDLVLLAVPVSMLEQSIIS